MFELTLNKRCKAPVEHVFAAWSSVEQLKRWFAPGDISVAQAEVDFRVGGHYRIAMLKHDGQQLVIAGTYHEIVPNQRLRFSWRWEGSEVTTEVDVSFRPADGQTDCILTHREFPSEEMRDKHREGWEGCLVKLMALD